MKSRALRRFQPSHNELILNMGRLQFTGDAMATNVLSKSRSVAVLCTAVPLAW